MGINPIEIALHSHYQPKPLTPTETTLIVATTLAALCAIAIGVLALRSVPGGSFPIFHGIGDVGSWLLISTGASLLVVNILYLVNHYYKRHSSPQFIMHQKMERALAKEKSNFKPVFNRLVNRHLSIQDQGEERYTCREQEEQGQIFYFCYHTTAEQQNVDIYSTGEEIDQLIDSLDDVGYQHIDLKGIYHGIDWTTIKTKFHFTSTFTDNEAIIYLEMQPALSKEFQKMELTFASSKRIVDQGLIFDLSIKNGEKSVQIYRAS